MKACKSVLMEGHVQIKRIPLDSDVLRSVTARISCSVLGVTFSASFGQVSQCVKEQEQEGDNCENISQEEYIEEREVQPEMNSEIRMIAVFKYLSLGERMGLFCTAPEAKAQRNGWKIEGGFSSVRGSGF